MVKIKVKQKAILTLLIIILGLILIKEKIANDQLVKISLEISNDLEILSNQQNSQFVFI